MMQHLQIDIVGAILLYGMENDRIESMGWRGKNIVKCLQR